MSEEHNWKFAQCFGDKGDSDDITDGECFSLQTRSILFSHNCILPKQTLPFYTFLQKRETIHLPFSRHNKARETSILTKYFACSWYYFNCWIWPNWWLPCYWWQRRTRRFIWKKRKCKMFLLSLLRSLKAYWLTKLLDNIEKELWISFLYRISIPWSRIWLFKKFGNWREN